MAPSITVTKVPATVSPAGKPSCILQFDLNTAAEYQGEFSRDLQKTLFEEFAELGKEIAEKGDIP